LIVNVYYGATGFFAEQTISPNQHQFIGSKYLNNYQTPASFAKAKTLSPQNNVNPSGAGSDGFTEKN
jgi:hypothetical protein